MRIGSRDVKLTNLDKVFFPERGLTKGDLIRYCVDVAPHVLHHVRNRPMQMSRSPLVTTLGVERVSLRARYVRRRQARARAAGRER